MFVSKTAALREAQEAVGRVSKESRTSYCFVAPYYDEKPWGPSTVCRADSYSRAVFNRTARVVGVALAILGKTDVDYAIERAIDGGARTAREILNACL